MKRLSCLFFILCFVLSFSASAGAVHVPSHELRKVEKAIKKEQGVQKAIFSKAQQIEKQMNEVRQKQVDAARKIHSFERKLTSLESSLEELEAKEKDLKGRLSHRDTQMLNVLASLQNLSLHPTEILIAQPTPPVDTLRSAILLKSAVPKLEDAAGKLKKNLSVYQSLRVTIKTKYQQVAETSKGLSVQHNEMERLFTQKAELKKQLDKKQQDSETKLRLLASKAENLKDLLARLEEDKRKRDKKMASLGGSHLPRPKPLLLNSRPQKLSVVSEVESSFVDARGKLPFPVQGKVVVKYGDMTKSGTHSKGITLKSRAGAQVISPYDGVVLFAGPFKGYGKILIIKHDNDYHTLLAGLRDIDGQVGQSLLAGEPIGKMSEDGRPSLYVELRKNGQPINPLPWLTASNSGVSGG
ncbi:MAG: peptidoglycan DD-metalloendopeptidase family protein [Alphaproteobacteria bacterium]|nr:peptidoglycan DD-metalloendopeptidase family protein [Alphaproteobacteria bacterium]